jgi:uncharacterized protein
MLMARGVAAEAPYVIAAVTGRALAASAARAGYPVVVLDFFADRDTRTLAREVRIVAVAGGLRFDRTALLRAAGSLAPPSASAGLVYGSGFEGCPGLLARLASGRELLGNSPEVVASVRDPHRFFPLLDRLGIHHPEVRHTAPENPTGWLVKHPGGAGGTHVRRATRRPVRSGSYFQRLEAGDACSVLFLADGRAGLILGFNRQWTRPLRMDRPFLYGGAVGAVPMPAPVVSDIQERLDALVGASGVLGLNGLDFLLDGERWSALELNARPTATMELYDLDYQHGLFHQHIEACRGSLPVAAASPRAARAQAIVHAPAAWIVTPLFEFPEWCADIPMAGTALAPLDPVCTVHAEAPNPDRAVAMVEERRGEMERALAVEAAMTVGG